MIAQAEYEHISLIWPKVAGPQAPSNRTNATAPALIDNSGLYTDKAKVSTLIGRSEYFFKTIVHT